MKLVLLAHQAATLFMVGVVWFVQVIHYPLFAKKVGSEGFALYSKAHSRLTAYVVGPPMLLEAVGTPSFCLRQARGRASRHGHRGARPRVVLIWLSTALLQAPRHRALGRSFDEGTLSGLVLSN